MEWVVETNDLSKSYGSLQALSELNLKIPKGGVYGFLGENGAGKTTAMKCLVGLQKPGSGSISLFGRSLQKERRSLLRRVGALIENPAYYGHLKGIDHLRMLCLMRDLPLSAGTEALNTVELLDRANDKVGGYSHGMKQRLGIAMALVGNPDLIILDEPTNGLDPSGIRAMRELIVDLPQRTGATVFVSSHLLDEVERMAKDLVILHKGKQIYSGSLEALKSKASGGIIINTPDPEQARQVLSDHEATVVAQERLNVVGDEALIPQLNQKLVTAGVPVSAIQAKQARLEDIYFTLMKEA